MRRILSWFLLGLLLGGTGIAPLLAQTPSPTGTLREVLRLEPAAQPLGGLIPYRVGKLLAYSDTSGQLIIPPFARWPGVSDTRFFKEGFVAVHPLLKYVAPLPNDASRRGEPVRLALLNARGEVLLVRRSEAAVRQPDGSVRILPHWQAHGQPEVWEASSSEPPDTFFNGWLLAPALSFDDQAPARASGLPLPDTLAWDHPYNNLPADDASNLPHFPWLGMGRVVKLKEKVTPPGKGDSGIRRAMADAQGHELTAYKYAEIRRFSDGIALAELPSLANLNHPLSRKTQAEPQYRAHYTYLDSTGQPLTSAVFEIASPFRKGRAVVGNGGRMGVIDSRGRFIVPLDQQGATGPDAEGYIALAKAGKTDRDDPTVTILPPIGKPPIARTFTGFEGFRQGRAEARERGRAGLIDEAGNWVTPLQYERLRTPGELHSDAIDLDEYSPAVGDPAPPYYNALFQTFQFPDSTLLVGIRGGKIGLVARTTGQEVVAARYDTVVLNPCHGMACLRRGGTDYLVSGFNGQEVAATYQGYDFLTAHGRRLLVMRAHPARWALADTLARVRTPWLPACGYPTAYGHLLSPSGTGVDSATLRSPEGKRLLTAGEIVQPMWRRLWWKSNGDEYYRLFLNGESPNSHYQLPISVMYPYAQGVYFASNPTDKRKRIYDARLRLLGTLPNLPRGSKQRLLLMESGWSVLMETVGEGAKSKQVVRQSFTDTGQALPPPPTGSAWEIYEWGDYPRMWRVYGVLPSTLGYVTRGKRQLWTD